MKLFHYTDASALLSIFDKKELWLTDLLYMNDSMELKSGIQLFFDADAYEQKDEGEKFNEAAFMTEVLALAAPDLSTLGVDFKFQYFHGSHFQRKKPSIFSMSFCQKNNLLSQWRGYTNQTVGYAIEFDYEALRSCLEGIKNKTHGIYKCEYEPEKQKKISDDIRASLKTNVVYNFYEKVFFPLSSLKHKDFEEESEVRLLFIEDENIDYRVKNGVLCPYIKVPFPDLSIIKSITVGPHHHSGLAKAALYGLIEKYFVNEKPSVLVSETPFRQI